MGVFLLCFYTVGWVTVRKREGIRPVKKPVPFIHKGFFETVKEGNPWGTGSP